MCFQTKHWERKRTLLGRSDYGVPRMLKNGRMSDTLQAVKFYLSEWGLSVIPLKPNSKQPACSWAGFQRSRMSESEIPSYFKNSENVGVVTGSISSLVVVDADTEETINFLRQFSEFLGTAQVRTRRGIHFYFTVLGLPKDFGTEKIYKGKIRIDVKASGGYVVAPPSVVGGHEYRWIQFNNCGVNTCCRPFLTLQFGEFLTLINKLKRILYGNRGEDTTGNTGSYEKRRTLNAERLKRLILPRYTQGHRQDICLYLAGWLRKEGFCKEYVEQLIREICIASKDSEVKQRLSAVKNTYKEKNLWQLKGLSGLRALGFPLDELLDVITETFEGYEPLGNGYFQKDGIVYLSKKHGKITVYEMVGPRIEIKARLLDGPEVGYEIWFGGKMDHLKEVKDLEKVRKFTGLAVVRETKYLEWLNYEILKCTEKKYIRRATGWHQGVFYHPALQREDIWEHWYWSSRIKEYQSNLDKQHELIKEALRDARQLAVVYAFCLASILNEPLRTNPTVCFITGPAWVGKTTLSQLGINLFLPAEQVFVTSHATTVGFELLLKSLKDVPILFDECLLKDLDLEKIVFMVASRVSKLRGTKNLSINVSDIASNVFFTSEVMEQAVFRRAGAQRRFLGLLIEDFQKSCFSKTKIEEIQKCKKWFGAGIDILKFVQENMDKIKKLSEDAEQDIEKADLHSFYHIALPLLTAVKVFETYYGEQFKNAYETCIKTVYEQKIEFEQKIDLVGRFKDDFYQFIVRKSNHIKDEYDFVRKAQGEIIGLKEGNSLYILTRVFAEFCTEYGFEQRILIKELIRQGILRPYSHNAPRTPKKISGVLASTYHIILPED